MSLYKYVYIDILWFGVGFIARWDLSFVHCSRYAIELSRMNSLLMWIKCFIFVRQTRFVFFFFSSQCWLSHSYTSLFSPKKYSSFAFVFTKLSISLMAMTVSVCGLPFSRFLIAVRLLVPAGLWFGNYIYINFDVYFNFASKMR